MRNAVVVDTSIALKWVLAEKDSHKATDLLTEWSNNGVVMLAPALFAYEITNVLHRNALKNEITLEEAKKALEEILFSGIEITFSQHIAISRRAIELAQLFNLPAAYDAHYRALAELEGCELWTADSRMWRAIKGKLDWVCCLNDHQNEGEA